MQRILTHALVSGDGPAVRGMASHLYDGIARMRALFFKHRQNKQALPMAGKKPHRLKQ